MDYDDNSLNSAPTMPPAGYRPPSIDEPSLSSAPTIAPGGDASTTSPQHFLGQVDQYALLEKLGGGAFGVVYKARDTVSGIEVALKTLHPLLKSNPEEMESLRAKFALVSRLTHQNIAKALVLHPVQRVSFANDEVRQEMRLAPGDFVMVMDYAPGVTLSRWRRQFQDGVVPLDLAIEVVRQIASALDYAHGERDVGGGRILTPHPGEAARLLRTDIESVNADRVAAVRRIAEQSRSVVVLKGWRTLVCEAGRDPVVCEAGNPGMATGGSGDVLTGVIAALWGQGMEAFDAACLGVWLHATAGDLAAEELGEESLIARDIASHLGRAFRLARQ
jgi:hypothetical protein